MRAGLLDEWITIKRQTVTVNDYGEKEESFVNHYTTKARVIFNNGQRAIENGEILHNYQKTLEVWKYVDIIETDQILLEEKLYRILSIDFDKKQQKKIIQIELIND